MTFSICLSTPNVTLPHWNYPEYFIAISFAIRHGGACPGHPRLPC
jgi:hypothetical protein